MCSAPRVFDKVAVRERKGFVCDRCFNIEHSNNARLAEFLPHHEAVEEVGPHSVGAGTAVRRCAINFAEFAERRAKIPTGVNPFWRWRSMVG